LECDYAYGTLSVVYARAWNNSKMNVNIKRCDFYTQAITAAAVSIYLSSNNTVNVTGNFYDRLSADVPVFGIQGGSGNIFNFTGNVYLNYTGVGNGRTVYVDYNTNKAFLNGTVVYSGSDTLATPLNAASTGTIIFKGWMYGTFKGSVMYAPTAGGNVRYENALLEFQGTVGSQIIIPTAPCNGNLVISNSTIKVNTSTTPVAGQANLYVTNSQIKNFGTADVFTNAGSVGSLQLLGSTIVTDGTAKAVNFAGSAPVTIADSNSNSTAVATTLNGSITTVSTINII
jgi:hypothetical protein